MNEKPAQTKTVRTLGVFRRILGVLCLISVLTSCSIPTQTTADRIADKNLPPTFIRPIRPVTVYFSVGSRQTPVPAEVSLVADLKRTAEQVIVLLEKGPSKSQPNQISFIANTPEFKLRVEKVEKRTAFIDLTNAPGFEDDQGAVPQLVLSLCSVNGISKVQFSRDGKLITRIEMSGSKLPLPLSASDFIALADKSTQFYFIKKGKLVIRSKTVSAGDDGTLIEKAQRYITELVNGPGDENADVTSLATDLEADIVGNADNENLLLKVNGRFDQLSRQDQALALGQILQTLDLLVGNPTLPPVELFVDNTLRQQIPDAKGVMRPASELTPQLYADLVGDAAFQLDDSQSDQSVDTIGQ